jgi:hypothetical protein
MIQVIRNYREKFFENWYKFDSKVFFIVLSLLFISILLLKRLFIIDSIAAFEILQERGEMWVFDIFFGAQYFSVPIFLAWKFTITAFILWVGCFMFGYKITYAQMWRWVMFAELVFLMPEFLKFIWLMMDPSDPSYQDIVAFYPLSLINLVDYREVAGRWHYPLKALNVFEPIYWLVLTIGVFYLSNKKWKTSVYIVASSYVLFFFLWLGYYILVYKG